MALALEGRAMKDDIMLGDTPKSVNRRRRMKGRASRGRLWKHSTLSDIDGLVDIAQINACFTFTLVRNPWDRMVSYYRWLKAQNFDHLSVKMAKSMDFSGFVTDPHTQSMFRSAPASSYMTTSDGIEKCDAYIRIEAFEADAEPLVSHLGFSLQLPHANRSDRTKVYQSYYSDKAVDAVAACCGDDIRRFGYSFE